MPPAELMSRAWQADAPLVAATPAAIEWWHAVDGAGAPRGASPPVVGRRHGRGLDVARRRRARVARLDRRSTPRRRGLPGDPRGRHRRSRRPAARRLDGRGRSGRRSPRSWISASSPTRSACRSSSGAHRAAAPPRLAGFARRPSLAEGYRIRPLAGPDEIPARVEVHRAAFTPSRLTVEKYERLQTLPHYRTDDDLVVVAPDGGFAAFAMAWWDPAGLVGEFEPVGTHPDHQRRGLSRALLTGGCSATRSAALAWCRSTPMRRIQPPRRSTRRWASTGEPSTAATSARATPEPDLQSGP